MSNAQPPRRGAGALGVVLASVWVLAVATSLVVRHGEPAHLARLMSAEGTIERGGLAADEHESPFVTSGQVRWRASLGRSPRARSTAADAWRFFAAGAGDVQPRERIFVAPPAEVLVYFGNFLWYPARLEVGPPSGRALTAADALRAEAWHRPPGADLHAELARLGYRHAVFGDPHGIQLVNLVPGSEE